MRILFISLLVIGPALAPTTFWAQSPDVPELIRVTFHAPANETHWVRIKADGIAETELSEPKKTNAWRLNSAGVVEKKPVAYVAGANPRVSACFRKQGTNAGCDGDRASDTDANIFVRGWVLDNNQQPIGNKPHLSPRRLKKLDKKTFEYVSEEMDYSLALNMVQYIPEFRIRWEWSTSAEGAWEEAGVSSNRLYVTYQQPNKSGPHFYTCVHLGCSVANGEVNLESVVDKIKVKYDSRDIKKVDQQETLKYWGDVEASRGRGLESLLENTDGRCGDWVAFFGEVLNIQGVRGNGVSIVAYERQSIVKGTTGPAIKQIFLSDVYNFFGNSIFPQPNDPVNPTNVLVDNDQFFSNNLPGNGARIVLHGIQTGTGLAILSSFFVKNQELLPNNKFYAAELPAGTPITITDPSGNPVQSLPGVDLNGIPCQGQANPLISFFDDHVIFQFLNDGQLGAYSNKYYDPSYGMANPNLKGYATFEDWANNSVIGYGTVLNYVAANNDRFRILWIHEIANPNNTHVFNKLNVYKNY